MSVKRTQSYGGHRARRGKIRPPSALGALGTRLRVTFFLSCALVGWTGGLLSTSAARAAAQWDASGNEGSFRWRGRVDGVDEIRIRGRSVHTHHIAAKPIQNQDYRFTGPLPAAAVEIELNVIKARGKVRLIERPSPSNGYTAVVRIDDGRKAGDAEYEFELLWRRRDDARRRASNWDPWSAGSGEEGRFRWRGRVDGVDEVYIRGRSVRVHHIAAKPIQDQDYRFDRPLPSSGVEIELNVIKGRGNVRLIRKPSHANNYTAVVRLDDGHKSGAANYEFELVWWPRSTDTSWEFSWEDADGYGAFRWEGRVDIGAEIVLQGRHHTVKDMGGQGTQELRAGFTEPLPAKELPLSLKKREGRGRVELIDAPGPQNNYTAVIRIADPKSGADMYAIELRWRWR